MSRPTFSTRIQIPKVPHLLCFIKSNISELKHRSRSKSKSKSSLSSKTKKTCKAKQETALKNPAVIDKFVLWTSRFILLESDNIGATHKGQFLSQVSELEMGILTTAPVLPSKLKPSFSDRQSILFPSRRRLRKKNQAIVPVARLFGPAIFEASKLKVLFLGVDEKKHPGKLPRTYTLTHSDITSKLTLAISQTINNSQLQGWYNRLQRDEVVAEWKKVKEKMSLHVHCHISGGHFLLDICARLRYFIFCKELPVVLKAFVHGDGSLFNNYPELQEALVWVYFHSNIPEFNKVECWGPLKEAAAPRSLSGAEEDHGQESSARNKDVPLPCREDCECCFPPMSLIPLPQGLPQPNKL